MEQFLFLCLTASTFLLRTNSQSVAQTQYPISKNPGHIIYFDEDSRPITDKINSQVNTPNINLQPPFERPSGTRVPVNAQNVPQFPYGANVQIPTINDQYVAPVNKFDVIQQNTLNRNSEEVFTPNGLNRVKIQFDQTAATLTNFSINVLKIVNDRKQKNTVLSPYSIAALLSLLQQGANDEALQQISVALQMTPQASAAAYRTQNRDILSRNSRNILKSANNIFIADAFTLNTQFKNVAQNDFDSDLTPTVFQRADQATQLINKWIASKTDNKINKLISPDSISSNTQIVLVNAIYFKGLWEIPFKPESTKPGTFKLRDGTVKNVPFMHIKRYLKAGIDKYSDTRMILMPFEREEYFLMILLPSQLSNADDFITSLTVSQLEGYLNMKSIEVALKIPKFSVRADTDLRPVLQQMGVTKIFEQNSGLSGIGAYRGLMPQVSSAAHSAVLTIDEEGGSAAASTAVAVVALSNDDLSVVMKVDRPFVAILWDGKTKVPLFMAKIEDPSL